MTTHDAFERELGRWLDAEASVAVPEGIHAGAMQRAGRRRQRPGWLVAVRHLDPAGSAIRLVQADRRIAYALLLGALVVATTIIALAAASLFTDRPLQLGRNGAIAYSVPPRTGDISSTRYLMDADGSNPRSLGRGVCPRFSGDGSTLEYLSDVHDEELWLARADGSAAIQVTELAQHDVALAPDGEHLAWFEWSGGRTLWVGTATDLRHQEISPGPIVEGVSYGSPVWSPDGRRVVFLSYQWVGGDYNGNYRTGIWIVDADGKHLQRATARNGNDSSTVIWAPDGRSIAYFGLPDEGAIPTPTEPGSLPGGSQSMPRALTERMSLYTLGIDDGLERLVVGGPDMEGVRWSPDGRYLAYNSVIGEDWHVTTIRMAGAAPSGSPTVGPANSGVFTWSPDGTSLLIADSWLLTSDRRGAVAGHIQLIDPEFAAPPTTLIETKGSIDCLSWQWLAP